MMARSVLITFVGLLVLCFSETLAKAEDLKYKDPKQPLNVRIKDLLGRMTLEEKIGQMVQIERANASADVMKQYFIGKQLSLFFSYSDRSTVIFCCILINILRNFLV